MGLRRRVPCQLGSRSEGARAGCLERFAVLKQLPSRRRQRFHVSRGNDPARAEAPHRLGDPAHVVRNRRHPSAERAQERAALVELRRIREDSDRRIAERAVHVGLRQIAEPPVDLDTASPEPVALPRLRPAVTFPCLANQAQQYVWPEVLSPLRYPTWTKPPVEREVPTQYE